MSFISQPVNASASGLFQHDFLVLILSKDGYGESLDCLIVLLCHHQWTLESFDQPLSILIFACRLQPQDRHGHTCPMPSPPVVRRRHRHLRVDGL